jgi:hypothetical protein
MVFGLRQSCHGFVKCKKPIGKIPLPYTALVLQGFHCGIYACGAIIKSRGGEAPHFLRPTGAVVWALFGCKVAGSGFGEYETKNQGYVDRRYGGNALLVMGVLFVRGIYSLLFSEYNEYGGCRRNANGTGVGKGIRTQRVCVILSGAI